MTRATVVRIGSWIALLPLLFLTAVSLVKYATWSAVAGGYSGLPAQPALLIPATRLAHLWLAGLVTAEIATTVLLFVLLPARLRLFRLVLPVLAVPLLTGAIAFALIAVDRHLH
jgi:hypothetical protein